MLLLTFLTPPFQVADEPAHWMRADQVSHGGLVALRFDWISTAGGDVDLAIGRLDTIMAPLPFHRERRFAPLRAAAEGLAWDGRRANAAFGNTAVYPPVFYLPAAAGLAIGRALDLRVVPTLRLSRLLSGFAAVAIGAAALRLAGAAAPFLTVLLGLPMSLSLFASASQDGPLIATAALGAASLRRVFAGEGGGGTFATAAAAIALTATARPAYLAFALLLALPASMPRAARLAATAAAILVPAAWAALAAALVVPHHARGGPPGERTGSLGVRVADLLAHPHGFLVALRGSLADQFRQGFPLAQQFVGVLGWLDTLLVPGFVPFALAALAACLAIPGGDGGPAPRTRRAAAAASLLGACLLLFLLQYVSWTPPGAPRIEGVQGRYILPIAAFLPLLARGIGDRPVPPAVCAGAAAMPALGLAAAAFAVLRRFGGM